MVQAGIFEERDKWTGAIVLSIGFHLLLAIAAIIGGYFSGPHGEDWGGSTSGSAMQVNMVSAVPLPAPQEATQNIVATDNKGLTQSVPQTAQEEPQAIPIPEKPKHNQPKSQITQQREQPPVTPPPPQNNVVPYGRGGPMSGPYGAFKTANVQGGFNFQGGGDFGSRYGWYVQVVNSKVSNNWYTVEIPANSSGHRVYILFDIQRDGSPSNVRIEQSSGIPAVDISAMRAIQRIDTFGPTPSGSTVSVEFWFDPPR